MSEWGDISICWSGPWGDISICWFGIRIIYPSGVTYLSAGPESG